MNPIHPGLARTAATEGSSSAANGMPSSQELDTMFLQLLVAQLQNQSPLNPMDPTQFVGQLAQFSELSEIAQINQLLQQTLTSGKSSAENKTPSESPAGSQPSAHQPPQFFSLSTAERSVAPMAHRAAATIVNSQIQGVF